MAQQQQRNALTELVQQYVGPGRPLTIRRLAERAVDPATGYRPSTSLVGKVSKGESYKLTPELVSALAAGLGLPRAVVAAAAHEQFIGFEVTTPPATATELPADAEVRTAHESGAEEGGLPRTAEWARDVARRRAEREDANGES